MEETESFEELVRQKLINHEFNPICIEASVKKANVKKGNQRYEKTEKAHVKHRKWRKTERGIECERNRGKKYRDKNKDNPEYRERKRANSRKCYRKKRINALWEILTHAAGDNQSGRRHQNRS